MRAKSILSLLAILIAFNLQAQNDPFANTLTASSEDSNLNAEVVATEASAEVAIQNVTAQEIRILQDDRPYETILLDARSKDEYTNFRIGGARWIGDEFSAQKIWMLQRNATIIIYGNTYNEEHVLEFCAKMRAMGFSDVRAYTGGIIDWINDGNTVVNARGHKTTKYKFDNRQLNKLVK
jgi:3-mercaptopyruvate sulfurtransferase SseA